MDTGRASRDLAPSALVDDQPLAGGELAFLPIDPDRRRAFGDEDQYVSLVVNVLGRPAANAPSEERSVQILGGGAPDWAAAWYLSVVETVELRQRQSLDQREQLALLEADVSLEPLSELAHRGSQIDLTFERGRERMQPLVVEEGLDEQRARLLVVHDQRE